MHKPATNFVEFLNMDGSLSSDLHALSDKDWISVSFVAGQTYRMSVFMEAYLNLVDASGNAVAGFTRGTDQNTLTEYIEYAATQSVTYYLEVYADEFDMTGLPVTYPHIPLITLCH